MVSLLAFVICFNYAAGLAINAQEKRRGLYLAVGVAMNVSVLIVFKYATFIVSNFNSLLDSLQLPAIPVPYVDLPLGVSFFTFQAVSYLVDIGRREIAPETSLIRMGVFKAFFPQLIAGPIVRYKEIAGDLRDRRVRLDDFSVGTERFVKGLAKKLLIADPLSIPVDYIFSSTTAELSSPLAWMGVATFALQIYFDFSGYSDMAIGMARMFGFHFPENFNLPYTATSVQDFWRRWHMTLSRWFRDYLYIPLGGNRQGQARTFINLWIVFATTGLWHGANWTFLIWGLWHGALLTIERTKFGQLLGESPLPVRRIYTIVAVLIGWVWFRATSTTHALGFLQAMLIGGFSGAPADILRVYNPFLLTVFIVAAILSTSQHTRLEALFGRRHDMITGANNNVASSAQSLARTIALLIIGFAAFTASSAGTLHAFFYFRF